MSDATASESSSTARGPVGTARSAVSSVTGPVWSFIAALLEPLDMLFRPFANLFNRSLGRYYGEVTGLQLFALLLPFLMLFFVGEWGGEQYNRALAIGFIWAVFAMSWDIQSGYTGYISFGHSALSGISGYTIGVLAFNADIVNEIVYLGDPPVPHISIFLAVVATVLLGLAIALISLRLRGPYFSLVTLVAVLLLYRLIRAFSEYTNGTTGITRRWMDGLSAAQPMNRYYLMLIPMVIIAVALVTVARSNVGLILTAIRENEPAVSSAGISPTRFKIWSFVISSIPMGLGGAMFAYFFGGVNRLDLVMVDNSIEMIAMAVIGGMASILGPLFGAIGLVFLDEEILPMYFGPEMQALALWTLVLLIFVFARDGVFRKLWHGLGAVETRGGPISGALGSDDDGGDSE